MECGKEIISVFLSFDHFLEVSENVDWFKCATLNQVEAILNNAFKIENGCKEMEKKGLTTKFQDKLHEWWFHRNIPYRYEMDYFNEACDVVLRRTLLSSDSESVMEYAVCCYLKLCGEDRFSKLVKQIVNDGISYRVLCSVFLTPGTDIGVEMKSHLLLAYWMKELRLNGSGNIAKQIQDSGDDSLIIILNALSLDVEEELSAVHDVMLKELISKMENDEAVFLLTTVDFKLLSKLCEKYSSFYNALLSSLIQVGRSFHCSYGNDGAKWTSNRDSVTFELLVQFFKCLLRKNHGMKSRLLEFFHKVMNEPGCSFWEDVGRECSIFQ